MVKSNTVVLFYENQCVKMTKFISEPWWALRDLVRIFKFPNISNLSRKLDSETCKLFVADVCDNSGTHLGTRKTYFVNKSGLEKVLTLADDKEKVEDFRMWIENEVLPNIEELLDVVKNTPTMKNHLSIHASLQKAQMLIRIAEHKAVPYGEQLRLLDLAAQELTGAGLSLEVINDVQPINSAEPVAVCEDITELPEVVGFIRKKETKVVDGVKVNYLTADMMAKKWRNPTDKSFSGKDFSELADDYGYKEPKFGYWQRVMTPDGEAREFMYLDGTMLDYMNKKFGRVA